MLYLTRKIGETVVIGDDVEVTILEVKGQSVRLGFTFPPDISVLRKEIYDRVAEQNREAATADCLPDMAVKAPHRSDK